MDMSLRDSIEILQDREAGWVRRRDAAEGLGRTAQQSIDALVGCLADKDMDVQMAVERSLEPIQLILRSNTKARKHYTLRNLAQSCEKHGERIVEAHDSGFAVTVKLPENRSHRVYIMPYQPRDGRKMIRIYTLCGESSPEKLHWALRTNTKLTHGAFALLQWNGSDHLVIMNNMLKQEAMPDVIKRSVKEMAYFGDWLEKKISGLDEF